MYIDWKEPGRCSFSTELVSIVGSQGDADLVRSDGIEMNPLLDIFL